MTDVISPKTVSEGLALNADNLISEVEKFLGAPYLWGGRTFFGIDCSGFVQCIMRRFGVQLPRDSKDQRKKGTKISRSDIRAGDLLFYPGHVTLAVSDMMMIHSSGSNGGVAYNSLDPRSPLYNKFFDKNIETVRRIAG
jgi:cell wall-associated NlpC family hydrolase